MNHRSSSIQSNQHLERNESLLLHLWLQSWEHLTCRYNGNVLTGIMNSNLFDCTCGISFLMKRHSNTTSTGAIKHPRSAKYVVCEVYLHCQTHTNICKIHP